MIEDQSLSNNARRAELIARAETLRPQLHRFCSRLMGSVIDGEDVVQDTLAKALLAYGELRDIRSLRPWLFQLAYHRALDLLRSQAIRVSEPIEVAGDVVDEAAPDPAEMMIRQEAIELAVSRFTELPVMQRSVVILKDVLEEPLSEIAELLGLTVDSVKAHLWRGRARLREIKMMPYQQPITKQTSDTVARYVSLFNLRDWDGLRALLAGDVRLLQGTRPVREGAAEVGVFFGIYASIEGIWLTPGWLENREIIMVFEDRADAKPSYIMWLEWRGGKISFIRDYRYVRYVVADAELILAPAAQRDRLID